MSGWGHPSETPVAPPPQVNRAKIPVKVSAMQKSKVTSAG